MKFWISEQVLFLCRETRWYDLSISNAIIAFFSFYRFLTHCSNILILFIGSVTSLIYDQFVINYLDCFFYEIEIVHKLSLLLIVMLSTNAVITFVILIQPTLIIVLYNIRTKNSCHLLAVKMEDIRFISFLNY